MFAPKGKLHLSLMISYNTRATLHINAIINYMHPYMRGCYTTCSTESLTHLVHSFDTIFLMVVKVPNMS